MSDLNEMIEAAASAHAQHVAAEARVEALEGEIQHLRKALVLAGSRLDKAADFVEAIGFALIVRDWADEARANAAPCDRSGEADETRRGSAEGESTVTGAARQAPSDNPLTETKEGSENG